MKEKLLARYMHFLKQRSIVADYGKTAWARGEISRFDSLNDTTANLRTIKIRRALCVGNSVGSLLVKQERLKEQRRKQS